MPQDRTKALKMISTGSQRSCLKEDQREPKRTPRWEKQVARRRSSGVSPVVK